jgi:hypothetical protein
MDISSRTPRLNATSLSSSSTKSGSPFHRREEGQSRLLPFFRHKDYSGRSAAYLTWPDARLRAYLRTHGMPEDGLPTSRPSLLQETRIRYVQTTNSTQAFLNRIRDLIGSGVELTEEKIHQVLGLLTGTYEGTKDSGEKRATEFEEELKKKGEWVKGRSEDARKKSEL